MKSPRKLWWLAGIFLAVGAYGAAWAATANAGSTSIAAALRAESAEFHDIQVVSPAPFIVSASFTLVDASGYWPPSAIGRQYLWLPGFTRMVAGDPVFRPYF